MIDLQLLILYIIGFTIDIEFFGAGWLIDLSLIDEEEMEICLVFSSQMLLIEKEIYDMLFS